MSDENTEEKKQKEKEPPKPWLLKQLEDIRGAIEHKTAAEIKTLLKELFENLTPDRYSFSDTEGRDYIRADKAPHLEVMAFSGFFTKHLSHDISQLYWTAWVSTREQSTDPVYTRAQDFLFFDLLEPANSSEIGKFYRFVHEIDSVGLKLFIDLGYGTYRNDSESLRKIGNLTEKLEQINPMLVRTGRDFKARAQALEVKEELKKETQEELESQINIARESFIKQARDETSEEIKRFDDRIKGIEARFIQIIGIFAAIIAFIVTIVPTAVRLGGASIPIALAGLAIVTAEIIFILAMVFGNNQDKSKYQNWVIAGVFVFAIWLAFTAWLALKHPKTLVAAKEDSSLVQPSQRIEAQNLYMMNSTKDTVGTSKVSPPPPPSTREGE